jgi:hypothetical protein
VHPDLGSEEGRELQEMMAQFDAPAYVRRARQVEGAYEHLIDRCRRQREEWLALPRTRLGQLAALAGEWGNLRSLMAGDDQVELLRGLHDEFRPTLRSRVAVTRSPATLRRAVGVLRSSLQRFNQRWQKYLDELDLEPINRLRDGYNRYYVLEKECATRSPRLAKEGFKRLPLLMISDVAELLPVLPVPRLVGETA